MKLLWSPMLDLTQWKLHREAVCPGNVLLPQNKNTESSWHMPNRVQSGTLHLRDFQSGDRASYVFLNISVSEVINATDCLEPTWMMRLSPCKSSQQIHSPTVILPFQWSFCLPPSFLFEDPCCYACHCLCWHSPNSSFLWSIYMSQTPNVEPGSCGPG